MTPRDTNDAFSIGRWDVYPNENRLVDGDRIISVEPRVMSVLIRLAMTPGQIVSADDLLDQVWPGQAHGDYTVYQAISSLRRALGDDTRAPRYIETIPKRGYRLLTPVGEVSQVAPVERPARLNVWQKAGVLGLVVALSIVFINWSRLSIDSATQNPATGASADNPQVRAYDHYQLGMNYLSRRSGSGQGAIAAAEFRRAIDIDPTFAPAYTGLAEVLYRQHLQGQMRFGKSRAESAAEIPVEVEALLEQAVHLVPTLSEAFVLRGRIAQDRDNLRVAEAEYRAALANSTDHVRARQGLASVLRTQRHFAEARQQLDQALALEPRNPALLFDVMHVLDDAREYEELMRFADYAVSTDPDSAAIFLWLNRYHMALGRPDRSVVLLQPLVDDPRFSSEQSVILSALSTALLTLGDLEAAQHYDRRAREHSGTLLYTSMWNLLATKRYDQLAAVIHGAETGMRWHPGYTVHLETLLGHNDHALRVLEAAMVQPFWNSDDTDVLIAGWQPGVAAALVFLASGQPERARPILQRLRVVLDDATHDPRRRSGAYYYLAAIDSIEGNELEALARLQQAADSGWSLHWLIDHDPAFKGIRENPDYRRIVASVREHMESLRQEITDDARMIALRSGMTFSGGRTHH